MDLCCPDFPSDERKGVSGGRRIEEDRRRFISRTYGMKQNLTRYFPAVPSYTLTEDGEA
jgi:hypothetical protein